MLERINKDLNERMSTHVNSMCATDDEVSLCWLVCEVEKLNKKIKEAKDCLAFASIEDQAESMRTAFDILNCK